MEATAEYAPAVPEINPWLIAGTVILATFMEVLGTSVAAPGDDVLLRR